MNEKELLADLFSNLGQFLTEETNEEWRLKHAKLMDSYVAVGEHLDSHYWRATIFPEDLK